MTEGPHPSPPGRPPAPGAPQPPMVPTPPHRSIRAQVPDDSARRIDRRKRIRNAFRIVWVLWALVWLAGGIAAVADRPATESAGETAAFIAFTAVFALGPLACHLWWTRSHPITEAGSAAGARSHDDLLRATLVQITEAADELKARGWSSNEDRRAIAERVSRLDALVTADEVSVQRGGLRSPVIANEIDQLRDRVLGLLDAAINSAAVAPGDRDLDDRLQAQLDALHARQHAVNELEGRPQPGY
ncbi:MAG: hypothetical protein R2733_00885 [Acidimicrobiales bacterium]